MNCTPPDPTAVASIAADFHQLFTDNVSIVRRFLIQRCGSETLADDIVSITFEQAFRRYQEGRAREVTTGWLITVARRRLVDHWRRANRAPTVPITEADEPGTEDRPLLGVEVTDALRRISPTYTQGLYLKYVTGAPTGEVAAELRVSYRAAESTLRRARSALRTQLADGDPDPIRLSA